MKHPSTTNSNPGARVTLQDVAEACGLSVMTVSRALRSAAGVSPESKRVAKAAAEKLGYRPDPMMSALAAHRLTITPAQQPSAIAAVSNFERADEWKDFRMLFEFREGAMCRADELGYHFTDFWLRQDGMTTSRAGKVLYSRGVEGIILLPTHFTRARARLKLDWSQFAIVTLSHWLASPEIDLIDGDHHAAGVLACHHLRHLGFRRIGLAMWQGNSTRTLHSLLDAYLGEQYRAPKTGNVRPLIWEHFYEVDFPAWLERERPDVLLTNGVGELPEALARLARWRHLPVVYSSLTNEAPPEWPGVRFDMRSAGRIAMDHLHSKIIRREFGLPHAPAKILISGKWEASPGLQAKPPPQK